MPAKKSTQQIDRELNAWLQRSPGSSESHLYAQPMRAKKVKAKTSTPRKKVKTKAAPRKKVKTKAAPRKKTKAATPKKAAPRKKTKAATPKKAAPRKTRAQVKATTRLQPAPPVPPDDLALVLDAVTNMPTTSRFGDKVYVSEIWRHVGRRIAPTLPDFKRWLLEQNRFGNLVLARGDLMGTLDASKIAESEIQDRGAIFHFVLDPAFSW
jgi:hypothetical protein